MLKNYSKIEVNEDGTKHYFNDEGKFHRLDGPAVEYLSRTKIWIINKNTHRNIDPSYEYSDGEKRWNFKGEYHRIGGSFTSYLGCWYIHDKKYTKKKYYNKVWNI